MGMGVLKMWNKDKGYGFIKPDDGGSDVFAHISAIRNGGLTDPPAEGTRVEYDVEQGERGIRATKVALAK